VFLVLGCADEDEGAVCGGYHGGADAGDDGGFDVVGFVYDEEVGC